MKNKKSLIIKIILFVIYFLILENISFAAVPVLFRNLNKNTQ